MKTALVCALTLLGGAAHAQDMLLRDFADPPAAARPRVWWHWMNGNISQEGIKLDLEWMKRIGLGGFQNFDASLLTPQVVDKRLVFMTPEWKDAFRYATTLADRLGLEMAIAGSPGWSESGGPWVKPEQAMKKLVWTETRLDGGRPFTGKLPQPSSVAGPIQNVPRAEFSFGAAAPTPAVFYADAAVVAFRAPVEPEATPTVTASSGGAIDAALLADGDLVRPVSLPPGPDGKAWIQLAYDRPQAVRALTIAVVVPLNPLADFFPPGASGMILEASDDGVTFWSLCEVPGSHLPQRTITFPPSHARYYRITCAPVPPPPNPFAGDPTLGALRLPTAPAEYRISELRLHADARVHHLEEKAAFVLTTDPEWFQLPYPMTPGTAVRKDEVVDLTDRMRPDGHLEWTPPPGRWIVLRMGYSPTGRKNSPASPEATGLEVDKLSKRHVRAYFDHYLSLYQDTLGERMGKRGLQYVITDSWEAGVQNWTDDLIAEFQRRRGYDLRPWLPVLTGHVVQSPEASDRLLWDFRRTLADLVAENHYDELTRLLKVRNMGRYTESHESGRAFIGDGMEVKRSASIPMSAMWTQPPGGDVDAFGYSADIRESASVAHLYGQNLVAAESLTANSGAWSWSPETLKSTADRELALGVNRFVIHTSVHQPLVGKAPGLGLGPFGQWFTRNETWAELAGPWVTYLARCSYLLQQGRAAADVLYFYGEDSNVTALFADHAPGVPEGYPFDFVSGDALRNRISVKDGLLVTPNGMRYRALVLQGRMTLPTLRKIDALVRAGATVIGERPASSPSLGDDPAAFEALAERLGARLGASRRTIEDELTSRGIAPDTRYANPNSTTSLLFAHRILPGGEDLYFVNSRNARAQTVTVSFRVSGREPEIWHPDTGRTEPAAYRIVGERTEVVLPLESRDALFVVFRKRAAATERSLPPVVETPIATLSGPWQLRLGSRTLPLDSLSSWSDIENPEVRYFSGTGRYTVSFDALSLTRGARLWLDLGDVKNIARVTLNGKPLGILWKPPFRVDITDALAPGSNRLEVEVTNLWVNRLIGDQQPGAQKRTFTTQAFYRADSPLLPSGLIGPVRLLSLIPAREGGNR